MTERAIMITGTAAMTREIATHCCHHLTTPLAAAAAAITDHKHTTHLKSVKNYKISYVQKRKCYYKIVHDVFKRFFSFFFFAFFC